MTITYGESGRQTLQCELRIPCFISSYTSARDLSTKKATINTPRAFLPGLHTTSKLPTRRPRTTTSRLIQGKHHKKTLRSVTYDSPSDHFHLAPLDHSRCLPDSRTPVNTVVTFPPVTDVSESTGEAFDSSWTAGHDEMEQTADCCLFFFLLLTCQIESNRYGLPHLNDLGTR